MTATYPATVTVERAKKACEADCNLHVFASLVAILEGGTIRGLHADRVKAKIIKLCNEAQQVELRAYDRALGRKET